MVKSKGYYGHADTLPKGDVRLPRFKKQREEWGFDDTETWSLDVTIAKFILPRLKRFREINPCVWEQGMEPSADLEAETNRILDEMIEGFELIATDNFQFGDEEARKKVDKALENFKNYYFNLWW